MPITFAYLLRSAGASVPIPKFASWQDVLVCELRNRKDTGSYDRLRGEIIEPIMCDFGVDLDLICARHGLAADEMLKSSRRLHDPIASDIVELDGAFLAAKDDSRFLVRSVAAAFDAHLGSSETIVQPRGAGREPINKRPNTD